MSRTDERPSSQGPRHWTKRMPDRIPRGVARWNAVLTDSIVRRAHALRGDGKTVKAIAAALGRTEDAISDALRGKTWRHCLPGVVKAAKR